MAQPPAANSLAATDPARFEQIDKLLTVWIRRKWDPGHTATDWPRLVLDIMHRRRFADFATAELEEVANDAADDGSEEELR